MHEMHIMKYHSTDVPVTGNNLIQTKDHGNVSPAQWTSVPTLMYRLRARLAETLMSTGTRGPIFKTS